jgi:hypothetical protein
MVQFICPRYGRVNAASALERTGVPGPLFSCSLFFVLSLFFVIDMLHSSPNSQSGTFMLPAIGDITRFLPEWQEDSPETKNELSLLLSRPASRFTTICWG